MFLQPIPKRSLALPCFPCAAKGPQPKADRANERIPLQPRADGGEKEKRGEVILVTCVTLDYRLYSSPASFWLTKM